MRKAPPAGALLLDAEGTLIHPAETPASVYARFAKQHGVHCQPETLAPALRARLARRALPPLEEAPVAQIPELERQWWRELIRDVLGDAAADGPCFSELFAHYGNATAWRVAEGAAGALAAAREDGWSTAVVSNMDARLPGVLEGLGLLELLDCVVIPARCALQKPDPRIFRRALEILECPTQLALYVGDRERDCLEGARAAGLRVLRYAPSAAADAPEVLRSWSALDRHLVPRSS